MSKLSAADILSQLIQFDTVSRRSNLELLGWVETYLETFGVKSRRIYDDTGKKANLIATIGDPTVPGYILSGHVDVVPVDDQDWSFDPFGGEIRDGMVLGRGASDMKGYVACVLAAVPEMTAKPLATPLHIVLSHDEEVGCIGVRTAIAEIAQWETLPKGCFVGEPTDMGVIIGHKAKRAERVVIKGFTAHSSLAPTAVNSVEYAARLTTFISDMGRDLQKNGARDPYFDVPHTTAHVGVSHGGSMVNIVPDHTQIDFEVRAISADNPAELVEQVRAFAKGTLEPQMQAVKPDCNIHFETLSDTPGLDTCPDADIVATVKALSQKNNHSKVAFGTEAGLFAEVHIPTVVVGPGNIDRAHKPDEFIKVSELESCGLFLSNLIAQCV
ncbi:acetylornithine deacetylase [Parasedimentitalea maritima]|uniref:Acetylornithine deacetylase n=1 Tax=Parasedimentitalea maritima TaxID=2578117 RepID=A0ABY2UVB2_9RHOB|nr:acetylornithine deacetylase [Zongyanglinia marina]TLP65585.1 acetylornithine deacetylase [Zongyanglinia marina]